ncbi:YbaY family lipoprotein [Stigmatella sp. ncwal1]|uniref:YbaY family lipoprotein n=1 Tax=Stigmatella ashevillensis TaxID=2995309 RepID=A0ABT5DFP1_9BACT|nr:YbaY family lipoprotein [Stigmatella ashevillena]MDC0712326.1 YbaY family lipoprotein [Stigmatella ashevillena]
MTQAKSVLWGCLAALALSACASKSVATREEARAPAATPSAPAEAEAPAEAKAPAAPAPAPHLQVTGKVLYRERIALTPEAVVKVEVVETGSEKAEGGVIAEQSFAHPGQVPIPFTVDVAPERIRPGASYFLRARILDAGRVYSSPEPIPVLTQGNKSSDVQVRVRLGT